MATPVSAASLSPGPGTYYNIDFTLAGDLPTKIGEWRDEWRSAMIQPSGADLAFRSDGVAPTGADGIVITDGNVWLFENQTSLLKQAIFLGGTARVQVFG